MEACEPMCCGKVPAHYRIDAINRFVKPVFVYRCARWPFSKHKARSLDIIQRKMLRIVSNIQRLAEETPESFGRRSARLVSDIQMTQTRWSQIWAQNVIMWSAHVLRNTNDMSWPAHVLSVQSSTSLRELRAFNGSRPGTRASSGFLPTRWTDSLINAIQFVKPLSRKIR